MLLDLLLCRCVQLLAAVNKQSLERVGEARNCGGSKKPQMRWRCTLETSSTGNLIMDGIDPRVEIQKDSSHRFSKLSVPTAVENEYTLMLSTMANCGASSY